MVRLVESLSSILENCPCAGTSAFLSFSLAANKFDLRKSGREVAANFFAFMDVFVGFDLFSCLGGFADWGCGYPG